MKHISHWIGLSVITMASSAGARTGPAKSVDSLEGNLAWMMVKTILALALVILLVVAVMWVFKRIFSQQKATGRVPIQVVGVSFIAPKKGIYLVDVADHRLVLGVTDQSIQYLTEIEQPEEEESGTRTAAVPRGFRQILETVMRPGGRHE